MTAAATTILVVDDDSGFRSLVRVVLERAGFSVVEAASGNQALAAAASSRPAAVLLDVMLPGTSGYEVCRELHDTGGRLPVLFVSGNRTEPLDRTAGLLLGADDYLVKPVDPDEMLARLRAALRRTVALEAGRPRRRSTDGAARLTPREREVLTLLAEGLDQRAISDELAIRPKTVGTHIQNVLSKLGARSRAEAVALAYREQLVDAA